MIGTVGLKHPTFDIEGLEISASIEYTTRAGGDMTLRAELTYQNEYLSLELYVTLGLKGCPPEGNILGGSVTFEPDFISAKGSIAVEGVHHCDEPEHIYTLELTLENMDFTLSAHRVFASEVTMTLEGYKSGKTLNWEARERFGLLHHFFLISSI
jgi:hypothetical protein